MVPFGVSAALARCAEHHNEIGNRLNGSHIVDSPDAQCAERTTAYSLGWSPDLSGGTPGIRTFRNNEPAERATALAVGATLTPMGCRPLRGLEIFLRLILGLTPQALCHRPLRGLVSQLYDCRFSGNDKLHRPTVRGAHDGIKPGVESRFIGTEPQVTDQLVR